jgi:hypothetical protein
MKLTKGKISKLYAKNRQSVKRKKNGKKNTNKSKTFRKKRNINLANKSLKQVNFRKNDNNIVPEYDNIKEGGYRMPYKNSKKKNKSLSNKPNVIEMTQLGEPVDNSSIVAPNSEVVSDSSLVTPSSDVVSDSVVEVPGNEIGSDSSLVAPSSEIGSDSSLVAPSSEVVSDSVVEVPGNEIGSDSSLVAPSSEVVSDSLVEVPGNEIGSDSSLVAPSSEVVSDSLVEVPGNEIGSDPIVDLPSSEIVSDPVVDLPNTEIQQTNSLNEAVNTLGIRISEEVLKIVSNNLTSNINSVTDQIQNGFNANKKAANTMASGGGKKRKTRKFKLTNKNKKTRGKR